MVVKFSGDSGDGMQLVGTLLSNIVSQLGNKVFTYPSYPADMRAPKNTIGGVSSFQVNFGSDAEEPGEVIDYLVCMNKAAYDANKKVLSDNTLIIYDEKYNDIIDEDGYTHTTWCVPATTQCNLINNIKGRNVFMLSVLCYYLNIDRDIILKNIYKKFSKKDIADLNASTVDAAYNLCENLHIDKKPNLFDSHFENMGTHTLLSGCSAVCAGLMRAAKECNKKLFLGSYPITPATDILVELEKERKNGVIAVQAEDEIAGCSMAIGASFGGAIGVTSTSGPGMCLKSEAINLAVMSELPLVIVDVMRGGPSTGLPTKTEQSDLNIAVYGRSGDSPIPVITPVSPEDCYRKAYDAVKIAVENMTPVILLLDAYIGNGLEMMDLNEEFEHIHINPDWTVPGDENTKTLGGSETDDTLTITTDPVNHYNKSCSRSEKIKNIKIKDIILDKCGKDVLLIGWGSTKGKIRLIADELKKYGYGVTTAQFEYVNPLPSNINELNGYLNTFVIEQNMGQLYNILLGVIKLKDHQKLKSIVCLNGGPLDVNNIAAKIAREL